MKNQLFIFEMFETYNEIMSYNYVNYVTKKTYVRGGNTIHLLISDSLITLK